MDILAQLGPLAFVSRMRRLGDQINTQAANVYRQYGLDFDPKCFPVFWSLAEVGPMAVTELAEQLGFSHPAIIQIAKQLEAEGLIRSGKSDTDKRKRILCLSEKGEQLLPEFRKVWEYIRSVNETMIAGRRHNLLWAIEEIESYLAECDYTTRFSDYLKDRQLEEVEIVDYRPEWAHRFRELNLEWISRYFTVEEHDLEQLDHPEKIRADGGAVLFARYRGEIVGTVALVADQPGIYEMAKMAVSPAVQGKQIGKKLGFALLDKARSLGARQVWLESNTALTPALELYRKLGFYKVEMSPSPYQRANIKMCYDL
jgi:DNA-binding MarR family transcriptional regulator/ribosomal protein S18 acetylase RimI-like enzyme